LVGKLVKWTGFAQVVDSIDNLVAKANWSDNNWSYILALITSYPIN